MAVSKQVTDRDAFFDVLAKSKLIPRTELANVRAGFDGETDVKAICRGLIRDGKLTQWQARQLLLGKHSLCLGKYCMLDLLGEEGLGNTYLAEHRQMRRRVVLKILGRRHSKQHDSIQQFLAEARTIASLDHRNIIHIFDVDVDDETSRHFLVTEHFKGSDLRSLIRKQGSLEPATAADYTRQAANGLGHAHAQGLVHGELSPAKLLVDDNGTIKISDIGVATLSDDEQRSRAEASANMNFTAPEVLAGDDVDPVAEVYSLGALLFYMLTGKKPPVWVSDPNQQKKHPDRNPGIILHLRPETPLALVKLCRRMLAIERQNRFQCTAEVDKALSDWLGVSGGAVAAGGAEAVSASPAPSDSAEAAGGGAFPGIVNVGATSGGKTSGSAASSDEAPARLASRTKRRRTQLPFIVIVAAGGGALFLILTLTLMLLLRGGDDQPQVAAAGAEQPTFNARAVADETDPDDESLPAEDTTAAGDTANDKALQDDTTQDSDPVQENGAAAAGAVRPNATEQALANALGIGEGAAVDDPPQRSADNVAADTGGEPDPTDERNAKDPVAQDPATFIPEEFVPEGDNAPNGDGLPNGDSLPDGDSFPESNNGAAGEGTDDENTVPVGPRNPFADLAKSVDLPDRPSDRAGGGVQASEQRLGSINITPETPIYAAIESTPAGTNGKGSFSVARGHNGLAERQWDIGFATSAARGEGPHTVAQLELVDQDLVFRWTELAAQYPDADYLRNCPLTIQVGEQKQALRLRTPALEKPFLVDLDRADVRTQVGIKWPPQPESIKFEITGLEGEFGVHTLNPPQPVSAEKGSVSLMLGEALDQPLEFRLATTWRRKLAFTVSAFFKLDADQQIRPFTTASINQTRNQIVAVMNQLRGLSEQMINAREGIAEDQRGDIDQRVDAVEGQKRVAKQAFDQTDALIVHYENLNKQGKIHYRVFFMAGAQSVDLINTGYSPADEEAEETEEEEG